MKTSITNAVASLLVITAQSVFAQEPVQLPQESAVSAGPDCPMMKDMNMSKMDMSKMDMNDPAMKAKHEQCMKSMNMKGMDMKGAQGTGGAEQSADTAADAMKSKAAAMPDAAADHEKHHPKP